MNVVLPFRVRNEQQFLNSALKIGFEEIMAQGFLSLFHQSDLDIFQKKGNERLGVLIYSWEMCEQYKIKLTIQEWKLPEELELILNQLVPWSLDMWFSQEWEGCNPKLKHTLIYYLKRAQCLLMWLPDMIQINWDFLLRYNQTPWEMPYLKTLADNDYISPRPGRKSIETFESPASDKDVIYTQVEQLPLIVLRLVKLFDKKAVEVVKALCMRVLAAWNKMYPLELQVFGDVRHVTPEDKRCLLLICHIYLIAVYESDDVKGYVIDNMVNNIRFYYQGFQASTTSYAMDNLEYTPARFIALTCINLRVQKGELFEFYIWGSFVTVAVNLFGVVSQAYKSYLLGNLLMEMNNMNDENFLTNTALYKRIMDAYINEREESEIFLLAEMQKQEPQKYAHSIRGGLAFTDFNGKICKGNRMSNIGHYENADDVTNTSGASNAIKAASDHNRDNEESDIEVNQMQSELSVDPIFQNIPNNEEIMYYVYDALSKKTYRGWQFAKIVLLLKIISHELNMLETWRYHSGVTVQFMLSLEMKLSQHFIDLAKIFQDYPFMEQEFWLTAFYLNPTQEGYEAITRLGIRNNRKKATKMGQGTTEQNETKYGLLSSTIDVKEIVSLANNKDPNADYVTLNQALQSLGLPEIVLKDILTVIFSPRNKQFSWAVGWNKLRRRCKVLLTKSAEKGRFVELTMSEAHDRLEFLNIDYDKYKNRPQMDYGSIERGYEATSDESEEEDDFEDDEDVYESHKRGTTGNTQQEKIVEGNAEEGVAGCGAVPPSGTDETTSHASSTSKGNIKECLKEIPLITNATEGFQPFVDIWNIEESDLQTIDGSSIHFQESQGILERLAKLKAIKQQINLLREKDLEVIDVDEMVIKNKEDTKEDTVYEPTLADTGEIATADVEIEPGSVKNTVVDGEQKKIGNSQLINGNKEIKHGKLNTKRRKRPSPPTKNDYIDEDEESDSDLPDSFDKMYRPSHAVSPQLLCTRRHSRRISERAGNSMHSTGIAHQSYPSSSRSDDSCKSSSPPSKSGDLVVTPRSDSGLKPPQSHADQRPEQKNHIIIDGITEVSSSITAYSNTQDSAPVVPENEMECDPSTLRELNN